MWGNFSSIAKNLTEQLTEQAGIDVSSLNQARENLTGQIRGIADSVLHEHQHKQQSNAEKQLHSLLSPDRQISQAESCPSSQQDGGFDEVPLEDGNDRRTQEPSQAAFMQALRAENEQLRQRLTAVEGAAADALGELEDLQERMAAERAARAASDRATKQANAAVTSVGSQADEEVARLQAQLQAQAAELATQQEANGKLQERVQELHDTAKRLDNAGRRKAKEVVELKKQLIAMKQEQEAAAAAPAHGDNPQGEGDANGNASAAARANERNGSSSGGTGKERDAKAVAVAEAAAAAAAAQLKEVEQQLKAMEQQAQHQAQQLQQQRDEYDSQHKALIQERDAAMQELQEVQAQLATIQQQLQQESASKVVYVKDMVSKLKCW
uniref:Uncharacterized protein n=1 Tax=Dunaliella tertiolecta TaxID=3047 RepID=A0A7S3R765_DUNTE